MASPRDPPFPEKRDRKILRRINPKLSSKKSSRVSSRVCFSRSRSSSNSVTSSSSRVCRAEVIAANTDLQVSRKLVERSPPVLPSFSGIGGISCAESAGLRSGRHRRRHPPRSRDCREHNRRRRRHTLWISLPGLFLRPPAPFCPRSNFARSFGAPR